MAYRVLMRSESAGAPQHGHAVEDHEPVQQRHRDRLGDSHSQIAVRQVNCHSAQTVAAAWMSR
jgi:hypothetical protein